MNNGIFFSWQVDTPPKVGRNFLREVLEEACKKIAGDPEVEEAFRELEVDSDTGGVPGQPPIVETIFNKIDNTGVYVADMTFVGKRMDDRLTPNPNVLIEYGYALKSLGYSRIICVMNSAYGEPSEQNIPFNIKHVRWPKTYLLHEKSTAEEKKAVKGQLITFFESAIRGCLNSIPTPTPDTSLEFPASKEQDGPGRFRRKGEELGLEEGIAWVKSKKKVFLNEGPCMWLRLIPETLPVKKLPIHVLKDKVHNNISGLSPLLSGSGAFLRAEDGFGRFHVTSSINEKTDIIITDSISFIFETGEIWSIDTGILSWETNYFIYSELQEALVNGLETYSSFLKEIGIKEPYKWKAGLVGVKDRMLAYPPKPGKDSIGTTYLCAADLIEEEGMCSEGLSPVTTLLPFFEKIFDKCGLRRPEYLGT